MRTLKLVLACCLLVATSASAQPNPAPDAPTPPTTPPSDQNAPAPDPGAPPQPLGGTPSAPMPIPVEPVPPVEPAQPVQPVQPVQPTVQPTPTASATTTEKPSPPRCKPARGQYYNCQRGYGIFHSSRLVAGILTGDVTSATMDPTTGATTGNVASTTMASLAFEGVFLGIPSSFSNANFHGIELSTGVRSGVIDFWLSFGTAVTFLNLGHGGPGTLRLGGSFGAGFDLAHGYGYVRGRGAMVIVPERLDVEVSAQWTPVSASTDHYDVQAYRLSAWYRINEKSKRAVELYVEKYARKNVFRPGPMDPMAATFVDDREILDGVGVGLGMSFF